MDVIKNSFELRPRNIEIDETVPESLQRNNQSSGITEPETYIVGIDKRG